MLILTRPRPPGLIWELSLIVLSILTIFLDPTSANPLTKKQLGKVRKLLEASIQQEYPSDEQDKYADLLIQAPSDKKDLTYYHGGNSAQPVFISLGKGNIGKKVHILHRGEDYINPRDKNNFVVLLQQSGEPTRYSVHMAHILDIQKIERSAVIWNDGRVEQQRNLKRLLQLMGNSEVQMRSMRAKRPLCDWIGFFLLCDTTKYVKPIRDRQIQKPLDKEDTAPIRPDMESEEKELKPSMEPSAPPLKTDKTKGGGGEKIKRNIRLGTGNGGSTKFASPKQAPSVDEEDEKIQLMSSGWPMKVSLNPASNLAPAGNGDGGGVKQNNGLSVTVRKEKVALAETMSLPSDSAPALNAEIAGDQGQDEPENPPSTKRPRHKRKHKPRHKNKSS